MRKSRLPGIILALLAVSAAIGMGYLSAPKPSSSTLTEADLPPAWKPEVIDTFERVAKTDDGRTKSFYTFAHYELLRTKAMASARLKFKDEKGEEQYRSLTPVEWMLDVLFHPEQANRYPVFNVEDSEALGKLGITAHEKRRDRYSYDELKPAREILYAERARLANVLAERKDRLEVQVENLATNLIRYEQLINLLRFAREGIEVPAGATGALADRAGKKVPVSDALEAVVTAPEFQEFLKAKEEGRSGALPEWMQTMMGGVDPLMQDAASVFWYPPVTHGGDRWEPPGGLMRDYLVGGEHKETALAGLRELEAVVALADDPAKNDEFQTKLKALGDGLTKDAKAAGAYGKVALDRGYLKQDLFSKAKWSFLLIFLLLAVSWLAPETKWSRKVTRFCFWAAWFAYGLVLVGMGWRVFITGWGPVTNLYETIPYITLIAGVFALLGEMAYKNRIALIVAVTVGVAGLFLASQKEIGDAADTMPSLQAVLRSNLWLWSHVTSINIGYATVMLAAIFSMVYIFCRVFDITRQDKALFKMLTQCSYGILCFGLFFSLIGTVLGGIWGNESWGRFWGWDPKENGALLIVLWCLAVLHMRLAGWIKEIGLHLLTALGANFCLFSWWHVNLLGIGLHAYGFTQGLDVKLYIAYGIVCTIVLLGVFVKIAEMMAHKQGRPPGGTPETPPVPKAKSLPDAA